MTEQTQRTEQVILTPTRYRTPVQIVVAPNDATWQGRMIALCDDGTVWEVTNEGWEEFTRPIPGSRAAYEQRPKKGPF